MKPASTPNIISAQHSNLTNWWSLSKPGTSFLYDFMSGQHATFQGADIADNWSADGERGSFVFQGTGEENDYFDAGNVQDIDGATTITISAWAKMDSVTHSAVLWSKTDGTNGLSIEWDVDLGWKVEFVDSLTTSKVYSNTTGFVANEWYNVVVVYDGNEGSNLAKVGLFVNGVNKSNASTGTIPTSIPTSGANVKIGGTDEVTDLEYQISVSANDGERRTAFNTTQARFGSENIQVLFDPDELVLKAQLGPHSIDAFYTFESVDIGKGEKVSSAKVKFIANGGGQSSNVIVKVHANDVDDAVAPTNASAMDSLARTTSFAAWTPGTWNDVTAYQTPELKTVIQEVVDRSGWSALNDLTVIVDDNGSDVSATRSPYDYNSSAGNSAKLLVTIAKVWAGRVDDVRVYDTNLSDAVVEQIHNPQSRYELWFEPEIAVVIAQPEILGVGGVAVGGAGAAGVDLVPIIIDDDDAEYGSVGGFANFNGAGYNGSFEAATVGDGSSIATWSFAGLIEGVYNVAATWTGYYNRANNSPYNITDSLGTTEIRINQQPNPNDFAYAGSNWENLGTFVVDGDGTLTVTLNNDANSGYVDADAIYVKFNDQAKIVFSEGATNIPGGGSTDYDALAAPGIAVVKTFTIDNVGTETLILGTATVPTGFTTDYIEQSIAAGGSEEFTITYGGIFNTTDTFSFVTNDDGNNPFAFTLNAITTIVIDDDDAEYSSTGGFASFAPGGYNGSFEAANTGDGIDVATWSFTGLGLASGWTVAATWTGFGNRASNSLYTVTDSIGDTEVVIDQRNNPVGFSDLGSTWEILGDAFVVDGTGTLTVTLTTTGTGYVDADAIRIEPLFDPVPTGGVLLGGAADVPAGPATETGEGGILVGGTVTPTGISNETGTDGILVGGAADDELSDVIEISGGALAGGVAVVTAIYNPVPAGGSVVGGVSDATAIYNPVPAGGSIVGGAADDELSDLITVGGGAIAGGVATVTAIYNPVPAGGSIVGGDANIALTYNASISGGAIVTGTAVINTSGGTILGTGGAIVAGVAGTTFIDQVQGTGGVIAGGVATVTAIYNPVPAGGSIVGGAADEELSDVVEVSGGAVVSGEAELSVTFVPEGGVIVSGTKQSLFTYNPSVDGGAIISGKADLSVAQDEISEGGSITSGTADVNVVYTGLASGGSIVSGDIELSVTFVPEGGVIVSGTKQALFTYNPSVSGGAILSGFAVPAIGEIGEGGSVVSGAADVNVVYAISTSGGSIVSGQIQQLLAYNPSANGGLIVGGEAIDQNIFDIALLGGAIVSGVSIASLTYLPVTSGGVIISGNAAKGRILTPIVIGGSIVGGESDIEVIQSVVLGTGGSLVGGASVITVVYNTQISGGALVSGEFQGLIIRIDGSGGALVTGTSVIGIAPQVSGGVSVGGIPVIEDSFFNKARNKGHLYSIGDGVYLRYEPKNNIPSRYERRTVIGLRFFGERNLYNVGIGILVDESFLVSDLNIDVVRSDEASETYDWAENQTEDLENIIPSSDPIGGTVADTEIISDGGAAEAEIEVNASDKINNIDSLTPISDPVGGVVVSSSETFNPLDRTSAILNKMKSLQDATVLPDPVGSTLRVTSVDSNRFENVANKAMARLEALQNTTVISDPLGGSLMTTYSEGLTPDNVTSVQNSMNGLEDVVLLPGPSGAYIIVSIDTEGLNSFKPLEADAIDKIKELGIQAAEVVLAKTGAGV